MNCQVWSLYMQHTVSDFLEIYKDMFDEFLSILHQQCHAPPPYMESSIQKWPNQKSSIILTLYSQYFLCWCARVRCVFLSVSLLYVGRGDHRADEEVGRCPPASSCDQKHSLWLLLRKCPAAEAWTHQTKELLNSHTHTHVQTISDWLHNVMKWYTHTLLTHIHPINVQYKHHNTHTHRATLPLWPKVTWFARPTSHCSKTHERRHTPTPHSTL